MKARYLSSLLLSAPLLASASALLPGDAVHGKAVHDQNCMGCHDNMMGGDGNRLYTRDDRRIKSIEGLMGQVSRCNAMQNIGLSDDDLNGITKYLNENFYKFPD